jgi:MYXO-CTERM domain-containing protein
VGTIAEHLGVRMACAVGGGGGLVALGVLVLLAHRRRIVWTQGRVR